MEIIKSTLIENIPVKLDGKEVLRKLHMEKKKGADDIYELVELANSIISPKALYGIAYIDNVDAAMVSIKGITFHSRVLSDNLRPIGRIFPFVVTIGKELEEKSNSLKLLKQYCLEEIGNIALRETRKFLSDHLKEEYKIDRLSSMSPGRLVDWPINEQKPLFSLFGDVEQLIGVTLNDSMLMIPKKSVSGVFFPNEAQFESCQLCPREKCESRKAAYDRSLAKKYGYEDP